MEKKLKSCPFCGCEDEIIIDQEALQLVMENIDVFTRMQWHQKMRLLKEI